MITQKTKRDELQDIMAGLEKLRDKIRVEMLGDGELVGIALTATDHINCAISECSDIDGILEERDRKHD